METNGKQIHSISSHHQHIQQVGLVQAFLTAAKQAHKQAQVSKMAYGVHHVPAPAYAAEWLGAGLPQSCKSSA
jgi:hypothetical protein